MSEDGKWGHDDYCEPGGPCEFECVSGCQHWCECPAGTPARLIGAAAFCNSCNPRVAPYVGVLHAEV